GTTTVANHSILNVTGTVVNANVQNGAFLIGSGNITAATLASGATVQGTVSFNGAQTIGSGVIVSPGTGGLRPTGAVRVGAAGSLTFASGSIFQVDLTNTGTNDQINATGAVTIANGAKLQINEIGSSWTNETVYTIIQATNGVSHGTTGFTFDTSNLATTSL